MRGEDERGGGLFSYVDLEARVPGDHPFGAPADGATGPQPVVPLVRRAVDRRPGVDCIFGLSGRRPVPAAGGPPRGFGPLIAGAPRPADPTAFKPEPRHYQPQIPMPQSAERNPASAQNQPINSARRYPMAYESSARVAEDLPRFTSTGSAFHRRGSRMQQPPDRFPPQGAAPRGAHCSSSGRRCRCRYVDSPPRSISSRKARRSALPVRPVGRASPIWTASGRL